jgi:hypothetical protein
MGRILRSMAGPLVRLWWISKRYEKNEETKHG